MSNPFDKSYKPSTDLSDVVKASKMSEMKSKKRAEDLKAGVKGARGFLGPLSKRGKKKDGK